MQSRRHLILSSALLAPVCAGGLATGLVPGAARAQTFDLGTIVVSPTRIATEEDRTGTSVSVVTEEDLKKSGDVAVIDYLSRLPGVTVTQTGPFGSSANLRIRGADQRYIVVYVDGIRLGDPSLVQTGFDFGALTTGDISRIEVLRGSQSALYGGSAVGGVISITTRAPTEEGTQQTVQAEGGTYNTFNGTYGFTQQTGRLQTGLTFSHLTTSGFSAASSGTEADGGEATRLSFSTEYQLTDTVTIGGAAFYQYTQQDYDGYDPITFQLVDQNNNQHRREAGARVYTDIVVGASTHRFELYDYWISREYREQGTATTNFQGNRLTFGYTGSTVLSEAVTLVYGLDATEERANYSNLPGGVADTQFGGFYGEVLWSPNDQLDMTFTARNDYNSSFGTFPTGRVSIAYRPVEGTTLRGAIARGFRAPSLDELYGNYPGAFPFVGNPNLQPEESMSYEVGVDQEFANGVSLSATVFRLDIDNLITYQFATPVSTLVNLPGTSVRKGVELGAIFPISEAVTLAATYTYTDARDAAGQRLSFIPENDLAVAIDAQVNDRVTAGMTVNYVAGRVDNGFPQASMPDYTLVGAQMTYALTDDAEIYVRAVNLLDEDYELVPGFATSGRAFYAGVRATF